MAERTPYVRASYDAVDTTPRPPTPPTTTGLPRRDGLSRCSTAAKNASRSRCSTDATARTRATYRGTPTAPDGPPSVHSRALRQPLPQTRTETAPVVGSGGDRRGMTADQTAPSTTLTARTPEDVLAVVPVVLGFEPTESLVMLTFGCDPPFHARADLPARPEGVASMAGALVDPARRHRVPRVFLLVYSERDSFADRALEQTARALRRAGVEVI